MTAKVGRPAGGAPDRAANETSTTTLSTIVTAADPKLVQRADRAVRAALREGLHGPDVEQLLDWVTQQRALLRRQAAGAAVADALSAIRSKAVE